MTMKLRSVFVAEILQGDVFRLQDHLDELVPPGSSGQVIDAGFVCDRCARPIDGRRWHCNVCSNFDLCELCQSSFRHEHPLHLAEQLGPPQAKPETTLVQRDISQMLGSASAASIGPQQNLLRQLAKERQARSGGEAKKQKRQTPEVIDLD